MEFFFTLLINNAIDRNEYLNEETFLAISLYFSPLFPCPVLQSSRINDQRCSPPDAGPRAPTVPDEDFFSLIQRVQAKRMDEQRVNLPSDEQDGPCSHEVQPSSSDNN